VAMLRQLIKIFSLVLLVSGCLKSPTDWHLLTLKRYTFVVVDPSGDGVWVGDYIQQNEFLHITAPNTSDQKNKGVPLPEGAPILV